MAALFVVETGTGTGTTETAGAFVVDLTYEIITIGSTDFTAVGAASNTVGVEFVSTGVGTGTGTAKVLTPANSYMTKAQADQYHENIGTAAASWTSLSDADQEQALRDATRYLDAKYVRQWKGSRTGSTNPLDWPRNGVVDQDSFTVASDAIPVQLKDACAEAALRSRDTTQNPTGLTPDITDEGIITYKREKGEGVGEEETHYDGGISPYVTFTVVDRLLRDLVMSNQGVIR